jgi:cell division protein FtsW
MGPQHRTRSGKLSNKPLGLYDKWLFLAMIMLIVIGCLMVASSSIVISEKQYGHSFHYFFKQIFYVGLGVAVALFTIRIPIQQWRQHSMSMLLLAITLLVIVLIPGIGRTVNGSTRWLGIGGFGLQVSELAKLAVIVYMAGFLERHYEEVQTKLSGFFKPLAIMAVVVILLLKEPDFGASVVITMTVLGMLFLAGVRLWQFAILLSGAVLVIAYLAVSSPYRLARLTSFLNPWANQFDGGYQLTQSLIAFGRGGITGVGLGESVQKLFYLPEAHTDFLLAVLGEELGLVGLSIVFILYAIICVRGMMIARYAEKDGQWFAAFLAYGITLWITFQAIINIGVNIGLLPTKGLTLPLMSSGGSSVLICFIAMSLLFRIDYEGRWNLY